MAEKVTFVLGQANPKKHSVQFSMVELVEHEGFDKEATTNNQSWRPVFYLPRPFAQNARKIQVTMEVIE